MLKVLILIKNLTAGGMEKMAVQLANDLSKEDVVVYLGIRQTLPEEHLLHFIHPEVKIIRIGESGITNWTKIRNLRHLNFRMYWKVGQYIRKEKIDVIYAHDASISQAAIYKLLSGKRLVWHTHNGEMPGYSNEKIKQYRLFTFNTDKVIALNNELQLWCIKNLLFKDKQVVVIPNYSEINNLPIQKPLPEGFNIVMVANIRPVKNHLLAVRSFAEIHKRRKTCNLIIVGKCLDGDYFNHLKNLVKKLNLEENVFFLGPRTDILSILKNSKIGLLTSFQESFGMVLLEYGQAKLPIVCSNIQACSDILGHGQYGELFDINNADSLTSGLINVIDHYSTAKEKAELFAKVVSEMYSKERIVNSIKQVLIG